MHPLKPPRHPWIDVSARQQEIPEIKSISQRNISYRLNLENKLYFHDLEDLENSKNPLSTLIWKYISDSRDLYLKENIDFSRIISLNVLVPSAIHKIFDPMMQRCSDIDTTQNLLSLKLIHKAINSIKMYEHPEHYFKEYLSNFYPHLLNEPAEEIILPPLNLEKNMDHIGKFFTQFSALQEAMKIPNILQLDSDINTLLEMQNFSFNIHQTTSIFEKYYCAPYARNLAHLHYKMLSKASSTESCIFEFFNTILYLENAKILGLPIGKQNCVPNIPSVLISKEDDVYTCLYKGIDKSQPNFALDCPTYVVLSTNTNYKKEIKDVLRYCLENSTLKIIYMSPHLSDFKNDANAFEELYIAALPEIKNNVKNMSLAYSSLGHVRTRLSLATYIDQAITQRLLEENAMFMTHFGSNLPMAEAVPFTPVQRVESDLTNVLRESVVAHRESTKALREVTDTLLHMSQLQPLTTSTTLSLMSTSSNFSSSTPAPLPLHLNANNSIEAKIAEAKRAINTHEDYINSFYSDLRHKNLPRNDIKALQTSINYHSQKQNEWTNKLNNLQHR